MRSRSSTFQTIVTGAALVFLLAPLFIVVLFSFHSSGSLAFPFEGLSLRWYRRVFELNQFRTALENSLLVAGVTAITTLILGTAASYGITRVSARLRGVLTLLFFLPITLPGIFLGVALLLSFVRIEQQLSLTTVMISHMVYVSPYYFLIARSALERLDPALEEVAADLGAGGASIFFKVTLPQVWPVLVGATALAFMLSFDEFVITFFVVGNNGTLPMFVFSQLRRTVDPTINVVSTLLLASSLVLWVGGLVFLVVRRRRGALSSVAAP